MIWVKSIEIYSYFSDMGKKCKNLLIVKKYVEKIQEFEY